GLLGDGVGQAGGVDVPGAGRTRVGGDAVRNRTAADPARAGRDRDPGRVVCGRPAARAARADAEAGVLPGAGRAVERRRQRVGTGAGHRDRAVEERLVVGPVVVAAEAVVGDDGAYVVGAGRRIPRDAHPVGPHVVALAAERRPVPVAAHLAIPGG